MHPGPTRRDILAAFLGLPATLAAGCARRPPPLPDGRIVGASDAVGHRLRQGPPPRPEEGAWREVPVVVIGAGVAGLSAAWHLERSGFRDFVVLELEPDAGGTARCGRDGVVPHPWGAHYLPAPFKDNADLLALLQEMGVVEGTDEVGEPVYAEQVLCRDPQERVWHRGQWYEGLYLHAGASDEDRAQYARFFREVDRWVGWRDGKGRRAFALPLSACSDDALVTSLDRVTMADWLDAQGFTSPRLRWLVSYGCRDDYGAGPEDVSAWAGLFYFCARRKAPGSDAQPLLTWPEGNGRLIAHLTRNLKDRLVKDHLVAEVRPTPEGVEVVALAGGQVPRGWRARRVIFAAPQFLTRFVLRPYRERPPAHVRAFEHGSWMVANLHLRARPDEASFPLAWDNVLYESRSLGYVTATHQKGLDYGPTVFTYYYPLTDSNVRSAREQLLSLGWDEWADVALADLERAHPEIRGLCERLDVMRWGHAMIRPRPGFVWGRERAEAVKAVRGVHCAHSDVGGLPLFEEAFAQGLRAAREVLAALETR